MSRVMELKKLVLEYSKCLEHSKCDIEQVKNNIYHQFHAMLNEHCDIKKIKNYIDRL